MLRSLDLIFKKKCNELGIKNIYIVKIKYEIHKISTSLFDAFIFFSM